MMKYGKKVKKMGNSLSIKFIAMAIVVAIAASMVMVNGEIVFQSEFSVRDENASVSLAGISYGGQKYFSKSNFLSGVAGSTISTWTSDKITVDVDGDMSYDGRGGLLNVDGGGVRTLDKFTGLAPDVTFELSGTPQLVDKYGNPLSSGYTEVLTRADGANQYMYWYKTSLRITTAMTIMTHEEAVDADICYSASHGTTLFILEYDGTNRYLVNMAEIGVIRNIYSLINVALPEMDGYTLGWQVNVDETDAEMLYSEDDVVYTENEYLSKFDDWPEGDINIWTDYDNQFHFNKNDNMQRSVSAGDKLVPTEEGGYETVTMGLTQTAIPGVARTVTIVIIPFLMEGQNTRWIYFQPTIIYDFIIKVAVVDAIIEPDPTNTTTIVEPPIPPIIWEPIIGDIDLTQTILVGSGLFAVFVLIGVAVRSKQEAYGY